MLLDPGRRRYFAATVILLAIALCSGPLLLRIGCLAIVFVPVLWIAIPLAFVAVGPPRLRIPLGVGANLLLVFSGIADNARVASGSINWPGIRDAVVEARWLFGIAIAFALVASVPLEIARMRAARNGES